MVDNYYSANMVMHFLKKSNMLENIRFFFFGDFIAAFIFHEAASYAAAKLPSLANLSFAV